MDDEINVSIRLEDDVLLKLTHHAHAANMTLNELCVAIMVDVLRQRRVIRSRNKREGHYFGKVNGLPKRVPLGMRAWHAEKGLTKTRQNMGFGPVRGG